MSSAKGKKRVETVPVRINAEITCRPFPGIAALPGESGSAYFERVTGQFCEWLASCLEVVATTEVV